MARFRRRSLAAPRTSRKPCLLGWLGTVSEPYFWDAMLARQRTADGRLGDVSDTRKWDCCVGAMSRPDDKASVPHAGPSADSPEGPQ